jgi:hypothetical protein
MKFPGMGLLRPTIFLPFVLLVAIALIFVSHDMVSHSKAEWDDRTLPLPVQARAFVAKVRTLAGRLRPVPGILPSHEQGTASAFDQETGSSMKQEVWARDAEMADPKLAAEVCRTKRASAALEYAYILPMQVRALLTTAELDEVKAVCSRCLFGSLFKAVIQDPSYRFAHVRTGDINSMSV